MDEKKRMYSLVSAHVEEICGIPNDILKATDHFTRDAFPVHIHCFPDQPCEKATTLCTIGLSEHEFKLPDGSPIRQELLFTGYTDSLNNALYNLFFSVAKWLTERQDAVLPGDLLDMEEPLVAGSEMQAFWFYPPIYFPDELAEYDFDGSTILFLWAIPVSASEMNYLEEHGADAFSDLLEKQDPDLINLYRPSVVLEG